MESSSWTAADARARPLFPWPAARSARVRVFPPSAVSPSPGPPPFVAPPAVSEEGGAGALLDDVYKELERRATNTLGFATAGYL